LAPGGTVEGASRLAPELHRGEQRLAAAPRPAPALAEALTRETAAQRFSERFGALRPAVAPISPIAQAAARNDLILEDDVPPAAIAPTRPALVAANDRLERLRALAQPRPQAAKPRPRLDDDLFEMPEPRRAAGGAR
jgi:hypothetical protein